MDKQDRLPADPVAFIQDCVRRGNVIPREAILAATETYELVEAYPDDRYLPSYRLLAHEGPDYFHVLFATDFAEDNVRAATAYRPDRNEWEDDLGNRRSKS